MRDGAPAARAVCHHSHHTAAPAAARPATVAQPAIRWSRALVCRHAVTSRTSRAAAVSTSSGDRKSTRLNSSHDQISYAVFCLKKKKKKTEEAVDTQRRT